MSRKSAYFFDFHGTISSLTFWSALSPDKHAAIQDGFFAQRKDLVCSWMRGFCTCEEIIPEVSKITGIDLSELANNVFEQGTPIVRNEILEAFTELRKGSYVFLISDNMDLLADRFRSDGLDRHFDSVWFSCENRALKNECGGIAYVNLAAQYDVELSDCILFDDSWSSIKTFFGNGGAGIRVSGTADTQNYLEILANESMVNHAGNLRAA